MPLYQYKCNYCGEEFERIKPISERETHDCPRCGQLAPKILSVSHDHWGFTLTEASHHNGNDDALTSRRPSNEGRIRQ